MGNIILSAFSDEYAKSFDHQLVGMNDFGIKNIEIRHIDEKNISILSKEEIVEAKRKLDKFNIGVSSIGSPIGKITLDGDIDSHLKMAEHVFEAANIFETKFVRIFSFYAPKDRNIKNMKAEVFFLLEKLLCLAKKYDVTLCHENEAKIYGDIPQQCHEIFEHFGGEIKCVFDMGNFVLEGIHPYPQAYELLKEHIAYFHIKDALSQGAIVPPGKGEAKIKEIITEHCKYTKNDFFVTLEPHLQTFSGLNALVGRKFENPYKYENEKAAFTAAVTNFKELIK